MTEPDDLDTRVRRLEREVALLKEQVAETTGDADAARTLAAGADRDVSEVRAELRAHLRALNALRETQREMWESQREMRAMLDDHTGQFAELRAEVADLRSEMREGFSVVNTGMAQISALLANIARDDKN